ncbi:FUSC family protein [Alloacidobacterium dinghuense]|uniref:FUSC family protein n=1 Tax=Alloacidobacterium dinghuense TaxID=2763107 RepID=A0A7G8BLV6_9BACT|nr:FUSC family protein [Alloacidobacterium dinghuense]QNI33526.1 FUSC family protein [Alloacidobacterium dinghuense]
MATVTQTLPERPSPLIWLKDFLKEELAPYPGRGALVARMVIAATVVMVITMTFKIPFGAYGAIYAFTISRDSTEATVTAAKTAIIAFILSGSYILIGAIFFAGEPFPRMLWVIGTFFLLFFALSATTNYFAANRFAYLVAVTIPLWDRHVPAGTQVEDTLWAIFGVMIASLLTVAFELIFSHLKPWDDLVESIAERLRAVEVVLNTDGGAHPVDPAARKTITRYSMLGTSRLRRILQRSTYSAQYAERMSAIVALTGRLVDLTAVLAYLEISIPDDASRKRIRTLAAGVADIRTNLLNGKLPSPIAFESEEAAARSVPLLVEIQRTVSQISEIFSHSPSISPYARTEISTEKPWKLFVPDAFSNPDHIKFGLRGCFAASLCYITYNAIDWPGISTAITTCLLTALTTIGSSRQKQILRFAGAILGGVICGMGAQIFVLPSLDSIWEFTVLFAAVMTLAAWVATCSPRLSYGGSQTAVAFCLLNVQEFKFQTSLAIARDRVVGILFGLAVMWIVFDQIGGAPAVIEMKRTFISGVRSLAEFMREPRSSDRKVAIERAASMREAINKTIDKVRSLADAVLFEFGSSRQRDMALRTRIVQLQPQLRLIFVTRIALLKYRLGLPGFVLPEELHAAQLTFDEWLAQLLDGMADRLEGKGPHLDMSNQAAIDRLEKAVQTASAKEPVTEPGPALAAQTQTFLSLSRSIATTALSLDKEI